jgi:hypothetical protein
LALAGVDTILLCAVAADAEPADRSEEDHELPVKRFLGLGSLGLALAAAGTPSHANTIAAPNLTGQIAVYDLSLEKVRTHDVTGATGQMRFAVADGCTGWGTTQHMVLLIRNADGSLTKTVTDYVTWETKNGSMLTFNLSERDNDGKPVIDDAGTAIHAGSDGSGTITYSTPANRVMAMPPGTLFPMAHTEAILNAGEQGRKFISVPLFDGTTDDGAQHTFVVILGRGAHGKPPFPELAKMTSTDVDIAFYERKNSDQNPDFRSQMRYYDNGVANNIMMDFGDFVLLGKLEHLDIPQSSCK